MNFTTPGLRALLLAAALVPACASQGALYRQLVGLPAINGGDSTLLATGVISGNTGYAVVSGGGQHRVMKIDNIGGANTVSTLVSTTSWNTAVGGTAPSGIAGRLLVSGNSLLLIDSVKDVVAKIDTTSGATSILVDTATLNVNPLIAGSNSDGNALVYLSSGGNANTVRVTTGALNGFDPFLSSAQLTSITGNNTTNGIVGLPGGVVYLTQNNPTEKIAFYTPAGGAFGDVLTEAQIGGGADITFSNNGLSVGPDGWVYFADSGDNDSIRRFDPANPVGTISTVFTTADLLAGPANSTAVNAITSYGADIAWVQSIGAGGQVPGFYAPVPEPSTVAMAALAGVGVVALRRKR